MEIDWSKAPEGATHFRKDWHCTSTGGVQYYKRSESQWTYWGELLGSGWRKCGEPIPGFKEIPSIVQKQPTWSGEVFPPVGTVCEIHHICWGIDDWQVRTVKYISSEYLIVAEGDFKREQHFHMSDMSFRPIRTAEQIAAEERSLAIDDMVSAALHQSYVITPAQARIVFERVYDAGYRRSMP